MQDRYFVTDPQFLVQQFVVVVEFVGKHNDATAHDLFQEKGVLNEVTHYLLQGFSVSQRNPQVVRSIRSALDFVELDVFVKV